MSSKYRLELTDNNGYAKALNKIKPGFKRSFHFLNAPFYGDWQAASGKDVRYFEIKKADNVVGCGLAISYALPGGYYYVYCPYGPLAINKLDGDVINSFFKKVYDKKLIFVRFDTNNLVPNTYTAANKYVAATSALQPRNEWLLDLAPAEDDLFANTHKKCRYHIRLAERRGASFRAEQCDSKQLDIFYEMLETTAKRDGFHTLPKSDYRSAFDTLARGKNAYIGYADVNGEPAAAALIISYDKQTHYVYGCSTDKFRKIAPSYYLHWQCILKAKQARDKIYNFGGISGGVKGAQLASVTQFKQRFGGYSLTHGLPSDIIVIPFAYRLFSLYKRLRQHN